MVERKGLEPFELVCLPSAAGLVPSALPGQLHREVFPIYKSLK